VVELLGWVSLFSFLGFTRIPKLQLGNQDDEALGNSSLRCSRSLFQTRSYLPHPWSRTSCIHAVAASRDRKLELPALNSQAGAWELALTLVPARRVGMQCRTRCVPYLYDVYFYILAVTLGAARLTCVPTQRVGTRKGGRK